MQSADQEFHMAGCEINVLLHLALFCAAQLGQECSAPGDETLHARIKSYELAARLQLAAPALMDISPETEATQRLYGLDDPATADFGRRCLLARCMIEHSVRFVQV
jgi:hypothetical protein